MTAYLQDVMIVLHDALGQSVVIIPWRTVGRGVVIIPLCPPHVITMTSYLMASCIVNMTPWERVLCKGLNCDFFFQNKVYFILKFQDQIDQVLWIWKNRLVGGVALPGHVPRGLEVLMGQDSSLGLSKSSTAIILFASLLVPPNPVRLAPPPSHLASISVEWVRDPSLCIAVVWFRLGFVFCPSDDWHDVDGSSL
jgi:hypothetical protein